jgi:dynein heavy chain, axonemal
LVILIYFIHFNLIEFNRVVNYVNCNRDEYFTLGRDGVCHFCSGEEIGFTPLEKWEHEYRLYLKLIKLKVFNKFRQWKQFSVWHLNVRQTRIKGARKNLENNLFILNKSLRPALLNVREMCFRISNMSLCKIETGRTYTLVEFRESQFEQLKQVSKRLSEFRELVKEVVCSACRSGLFEAGFTPDNYASDAETMMDGIGGAPGTASSYFGGQSNYNIDIYGQAPDKMTYTEQANKRSHCQRLTCFVRLSDYLITSTLHVLSVNSVQSLFNYYTEQLTNTPTIAEIEATNKMPEIEEDGADGPNTDTPEQQPDQKSLTKEKSITGPPLPGQMEEEEKEEEIIIIPPLYITEFVLDVYSLTFSPDLEQFREIISEIMQQFKETLLQVNNLVSDEYFDPFTRPRINHKHEEKTCGEGPKLETMFEDDADLRNLENRCRECLSAAFNAAQQFADTFQPYRLFYRENEETDIDKMAIEEHDVEFFETHLAKYHKEEKMVAIITLKRHLGMLLVDSTKMKDLLIPNPKRCLDVVNDILPMLAKNKTDSLIAESQQATFKLESKPTTTLDYVNSLTFLEEIQQRIDQLEKESDTVKDMYSLIDEYKVPCPPEDRVVHATLHGTITLCRNAIDKALTEYDSNIKKFCDTIEKDFAGLMENCRQIQQQAQVILLNLK